MTRSINEDRPRIAADHSEGEETTDTNSIPILSLLEPSGMVPTVGLNPLNWFGILVSCALKTAQAEFKAAVMEGITELASLICEMRQAELEISNLRRLIRSS